MPKIEIKKKVTVDLPFTCKCAGCGNELEVEVLEHHNGDKVSHTMVVEFCSVCSDSEYNTEYFQGKDEGRNEQST